VFQKVLVANRGEIALRVMRTCKALGIRTVAVYSDADADALHVLAADEARRIGPPPAAQSYLNMDRIIEVAKETGAEAIHPGYGFLSENPVFAERCREAGIVFIGPSRSAIAAMGSKIEARRKMQEAGVPVVPGIVEPLADENEAAAVAAEFGYPVMLKASAGGGGIGMQVVHNEEELRKAWAANRGRVKAYFGDDAMYIEKYIVHPRHIEVQVLADSQGNTVYLWERECSVQRRHQKVIEEAPFPFADETLRKKMGEAAVRAARSIGYENAGTIEFLVDAERNFYFLEMNTRLQVEHPVTEAITGLDLVKEQLRIAAGEPLGYGQNDIRRSGHAIECRIYAEDPKTFFPSPGTIETYEPPTAPFVRNETAVRSGSVVSPHYDPMIAKLIVHGNDRAEAIERMKQALAQYNVTGIKTNIPVLRQIVAHEAFAEGRTTTDFISRYIYPQP
jgi:acetyl-CoA carboxylase biotin carboxylase subunit